MNITKTEGIKPLIYNLTKLCNITGRGFAFDEQTTSMSTDGQLRRFTAIPAREIYEALNRSIRISDTERVKLCVEYRENLKALGFNGEDMLVVIHTRSETDLRVYDDNTEEAIDCRLHYLGNKIEDQLEMVRYELIKLREVAKTGDRQEIDDSLEKFQYKFCSEFPKIGKIPLVKVRD